jgi:predicted nucleic acid-binding Zn ribbon protein
MKEGLKEKILWRKETMTEAFRHCVDYGKPLPRHGNTPAKRCRICNIKIMRGRRQKK